MPSQRVYELAEELGFNRQELVTKINSLALGFQVNNYMTKLSPEEVSELKDALEGSGEGVQETEQPATETKDQCGVLDRKPKPYRLPARHQLSSSR